ncbi:MAG TPA: SRPBCC family protein [Desulfobacterales bacterium]
MFESANSIGEVKELFAREVQIHIQAPCAEVFHYLADINRHSEWADNPLEIRHVSGPPGGVGATFESVARRTARVAGTFTGRIRIVAAEPPHRFAYEVEDNTGHYRWTMLVTPEGNGTRLTQRMAKLSGPWLINLFQPWLIWPLIGRPQVKGGLKRIKIGLERAE